MLGSPLVRTAVALAALLLLLVPLRSFTAARPAAAPPATVAATPASTVRLEIVATKFPFTFSVRHLGKILWQGESPAASIATGTRLPIPAEGVDLALRLDWPGEGMAAAKLILTRDGEDPVERTVWGDRTAEDVLTFP